MSRGASEAYALEPAERQILLDVCETLEERLAIKLPMFLGLRAGEAVHLNSSWLRADGQLGVPGQMPCGCIDCITARRSTWTPKTKAGARIIPIAETAFKDLTILFRESPKGLEISRGAFYWRVKRLLTRAGIKKFGASKGTAFPHALRATCATMWAEIGFNTAEICYCMGWSNLSIAQHYINRALAAKGAQDKLRAAGL